MRSIDRAQILYRARAELVQQDLNNHVKKHDALARDRYLSISDNDTLLSSKVGSFEGHMKSNDSGFSDSNMADGGCTERIVQFSVADSYSSDTMNAMLEDGLNSGCVHSDFKIPLIQSPANPNFSASARADMSPIALGGVVLLENYVPQTLLNRNSKDLVALHDDDADLEDNAYAASRRENEGNYILSAKNHAGTYTQKKRIGDAIFFETCVTKSSTNQKVYSLISPYDLQLFYVLITI